MTDYINFVKDFAKRTLENAVLIAEQKSERNEGYEVTQLINSFFGLLVFPLENDKQNKNNKQNDNQQDSDTLKWLKHCPNEPQCNFYTAKTSKYRGHKISEYERMIRCLRNAVAHKGLRALTESELTQDGQHTSPSQNLFPEKVGEIAGFEFTEKKESNVVTSYKLSNQQIFDVLINILHNTLEADFPKDKAVLLAERLGLNTDNIPSQK